MVLLSHEGLDQDHREWMTERTANTLDDGAILKRDTAHAGCHQQESRQDAMLCQSSMFNFAVHADEQC
ncbi:MAG: hypothetical protein R3F19_18220 [Verrucomicrobiales bacterium]